MIKLSTMKSIYKANKKLDTQIQTIFFSVFFNKMKSVFSIVTSIKNVSLNFKSLMFILLQKSEIHYLYDFCHLKIVNMKNLKMGPY